MIRQRAAYGATVILSLIALEGCTHPNDVAGWSHKDDVAYGPVQPRSAEYLTLMLQSQREALAWLEEGLRRANEQPPDSSARPTIPSGANVKLRQLNREDSIAAAEASLNENKPRLLASIARLEAELASLPNGAP